MKTQQEIEQMKTKKQEDISYLSLKANNYYQLGDKVMFDHYDREHAKAVAQYNILLEVLR